MYLPLTSCTKFAAHQEMCQIIESMTESVIDYTFRGRNNYFVMEGENQNRYIIYVFMICTSNEGWLMKVITESEYIPNLDCPLRLIRQSNCNDEVAMKWRSQVRQVADMAELEKISSKNENQNTTCLCRLKHSESKQMNIESIKIWNKSSTLQAATS